MKDKARPGSKGEEGRKEEGGLNRRERDKIEGRKGEGAGFE